MNPAILYELWKNAGTGSISTAISLIILTIASLFMWKRYNEEPRSSTAIRE